MAFLLWNLDALLTIAMTAATALFLSQASPMSACRKLLEVLHHSQHATERQGAVAVVSELVAQMQEQLLPYMFLIIVPSMKLMSDQTDAIRASATTSFAAMVTMLPLAQVIHQMNTSKHACILRQRFT